MLPIVRESKNLRVFQSQVLKDCVRYRTTESMDDWLNLTPSHATNEQSKNGQITNVVSISDMVFTMLIRINQVAAADNGCIEECIYYPDTGSIDDEQVT